MPPEVDPEAVNATSDGAEEILLFKVWLKRLSPMIWRRIEVRADTTLRELHGIIQVAMAWEGTLRSTFEKWYPGMANDNSDETVLAEAA